MKPLLYICTLASLILGVNAQAAPAKTVQAAAKMINTEASVQATQVSLKTAVVSHIQVTTGDTAAGYYLYTPGNWQTVIPTECSTPVYAFIDSSKVGSDALMSLALTAKTTETPLTIIGNCAHRPLYFEIVTIIF
ncbi:MAG: hypothetical protein ACI9FJ_001178 [Alteromonadaceae bacterium]|jgi:hypothetical protein